MVPCFCERPTPAGGRRDGGVLGMCEPGQTPAAPASAADAMAMAQAGLAYLAQADAA